MTALTLQMVKSAVILALAASLALAGCATSPQPSQDVLATDKPAAPAPAAVGQRELTPQEKKVIIDAVAPSIRDAGSAKYRWAKVPIVAQGEINYCAMVNAKSPFAAYSGWQAYIIEGKVVGGRLTSAVVGLIAGGKDTVLVSRMCAKYGLNPNDAT